MAWFTYQCSEHGEFKLSLTRREKTHPCPKCGVDAKPVIKPTGSVSIVERLDNGAMGRAVERLHNIEEIMNDRADKHTAEHEERYGGTDEE